MNKGKRIFYVEDDESLAFLTKDNLEMQGFQVEYISDGTEALNTYQNNQYDICVLDIMLPGTDGISLAQHIRSNDKHIPIIFLTAKNQKNDRIDGLKIGADDYITKPFSIEELILKIEVFLKRSKISEADQCSDIMVGSFCFEPANFLLKRGGQNEKLTEKESNLLELFCNNSNRILTREFILENLWGGNDYFSGRSLDVFISRLRKYLKADSSVHIETIHGTGFRFNIKK